MIRRFVAGLLALPLLTSLAWAEVKPPTYRALFNGTDLKGWQGMPHFDPRKLAEMSEEDKKSKFAEWNADRDMHWKVENGEIVNDGHGVFLTTEESFQDFELLIDFKTVPLADSGIYLKSSPQVQIWDPADPNQQKNGANLGSGGLWNNNPGNPGKNPLSLVDTPFGEWNRFRILQVGARTSVWLNDKLVVDFAVMDNYWVREKPLFPSGQIQLQTHGGEIRWRNVFIRELSDAEANDYLRMHSEPGMTPLFNGSDLTGWQGATDSYEVAEGAIRCKAGQGGVLHTADKYGNFKARVEFKLPAGGNNGLAIRYPGEGDGAYVGMCELQVLDTEHEKYGKLDPRQAHGSAYGMAAAHRGYLRPTGEWNYQEVTVNGSTVKVELNGTLILDTDLSKITEYMANSPHPGKELTEGYFGFAGHNDPVEFRNVAIKKIE